MTKVCIGVDPGLKGAIALLTPDRIEVRPMPVVTSVKGRDQYDLPGIRQILVDARSVAGRFDEILVTIEKLQPLPARMGGGGKCPACKQPVGGIPMGGTIANYNRGRAMALIEMACVALGIPYLLVAPRTWQAIMHAGTSGEDLKQRSIMAAQRLFPSVSLLRTPSSRVPSDGMAEALLLAQFGQRTHNSPLLDPIPVIRATLRPAPKNTTAPLAAAS